MALPLCHEVDVSPSGMSFTLEDNNSPDGSLVDGIAVSKTVVYSVM